MRLREDQASRGVLRVPCESLAARGHGLGHAPGLPVEVGELRERQRPGVARDTLLGASDLGGEIV